MVKKSVPVLPVFLYDGDCGFCSSCARFVDRRIHTPVVVQPWQWTELDPLRLTVDEVDQAVVWVTAPGDRTAGPGAIADLLLSSTRWWWRLSGRVLSPRPIQRILWPLYRWVARNRHRMPGGTAQCSLPHAQRDLET